MSDKFVRFAGITSAKHRVAMYRDYGWAEFKFADGALNSNTIDLGPAANIAIDCPVAANGKTVSIQVTHDDAESTWVTLATKVLATGMNYFLGDEASKVMHVQRTRLVLDTGVTGGVTLWVSIKG